MPFYRRARGLHDPGRFWPPDLLWVYSTLDMLSFPHSTSLPQTRKPSSGFAFCPMIVSWRPCVVLLMVSDSSGDLLNKSSCCLSHALSFVCAILLPYVLWTPWHSAFSICWELFVSPRRENAHLHSCTFVVVLTWQASRVEWGSLLWDNRELNLIALGSAENRPSWCQCGLTGSGLLAWYHSGLDCTLRQIYWGSCTGDQESIAFCAHLVLKNTILYAKI